MTKKTDATDTVAEIAEKLRGSGASITGGWLDPRAAWRFYWQNGTVRQLVGRFATLMTKSWWDYARADVSDFNWSTTKSRLETKKFKQALKLASLWAFIFGGGAIEYIVDIGPDSDKSKPLPDSPYDSLRDFKGIKVWSAYALRPEPGQIYNTAEYFYPYQSIGASAHRIHRSRLSLLVTTGTPADTSDTTYGFINTETSWPPSWLEGIYEAFCDWKSSHADASAIIHTKSLLHLKLKGYREAWTSPDSTEAAAVLAGLEQIAENLTNEGLLVTDIEDLLAEVERSLAGLPDVLQAKALRLTSATGVPKELVLMEAAGNLGDNSAPIDAYYDMIDGWRDEMLVPAIEKASDLELAHQRYEARLRGEKLVVPGEYTVEFKPIQDLDAKEKSEARSKQADARKKDIETGVPMDAVLSDPALADDYPNLPAILEEQQQLRAKAAEATAAAEVDDPEGEDMVSSSAVAAKLGVSPATVIKMAVAGSLPGRKIAGRWKFYMSKVLAALKDPDGQPQDRADAEIGLSESTEFGRVYGASTAMREIFAVLERIAESDLAVLLLGETGVGKEGIARGLHRSGEFVVVNCAALPWEPDEVEREIEAALAESAGGTLFLDEIGDLSSPGQSALLRLLAGEVTSRMVSATSREIVRDPYSFRPDLYFRIAGVEVEIPPLRDREEDVHHLAKMFYDAYTSDRGYEPAEPAFTEAALAAMLVYPWPGNVRELRSAVGRGVELAGRARSVGPEHLQLRMGGR